MTRAAEVESLVREGRYEEAASACLEHGQPARAAELLARIWKYSDAVRVASEAGLYDEAYRHALASNDGELAKSLLASISARPEQAARAAEHAESRGRIADAARLREAAGELDAAAAFYERAGELDEAGRCWKELGELKKAGILYEKRLREVPGDAATAFELGQILVRFGRWDHAARALQQACRETAFAVPAGKLLVAAFHALGLHDAAASRLDLLREADPRLPARVPDMLLAVFGDERGPGSLDESKLVAARYRIVRALGQGSTGRVLLAEDAFHGREVAIKILHAEGAYAVGRDALSRFAREAKVAAGIAHANVVAVHDYFPEGPFIVMEYMSEGTLEDRFAETNGGPIAPSVARHVLRSVLRALEAVHRRGVVHRDLKPANVFFGPAGEVKLGDFGVAHLVDLGTTLTGAMMGTLAYMSPEQITGTTRPDASTDLYALGVIFYRMLTGVLPLAGPDFVTQHVEHTPEPASRHAPWLDPEFDALIAWMLEKTQERRPHTATDVLERVDALPWSLLDESRREVREHHAFAEEPPSRPSILPDSDRYRSTRVDANGFITAFDVLLERLVRIVPCDSVRANALRAAGRANCPFIQAVWSIDEDEKRAILENPDRSSARRPLGERAFSELREALAALHARGLAHGAVDKDHVARGAGRTVLLIESAPLAGSSKSDIEALEKLEKLEKPEA
jgi:serine/threonine-protein kinase